jgi:ABC-type lipoprotein release transport system permease subunit
VLAYPAFTGFLAMFRLSVSLARTVSLAPLVSFGRAIGTTFATVTLSLFNSFWHSSPSALSSSEF